MKLSAKRRREMMISHPAWQLADQVLTLGNIFMNYILCSHIQTQSCYLYAYCILINTFKHEIVDFD